MSKFKVGDRVVVTNAGRTYSAYKDFVICYAPDYFEFFRRGESPNNDDAGIIVGIGIHDLHAIPCAVVLIKETVFVIDFDGIKRHKPKEPRYTISEIRENPSLIKDIVLENVKKALEE